MVFSINNENGIKKPDKKKLTVKGVIYSVMNLFRFSLLFAWFYIVRSKSSIRFHIFHL